MTIVAIPSTSDRGLDAEMDFRLGRCPFFTFVELDATNKVISVTVAPNPGTTAMGGAGSMCVQFVSSRKADTVVVANVGPNAAAALAASGMKVVSLKDMSRPPYTVDSIIDELVAGNVVPFTGANVASHAGMGGGGMGGGGMGGGGGRNRHGQQ